jgi:hypothetical protein
VKHDFSTTISSSISHSIQLPITSQRNDALWKPNFGSTQTSSAVPWSTGSILKHAHTSNVAFQTGHSEVHSGKPTLLVRNTPRLSSQFRLTECDNPEISHEWLLFFIEQLGPPHSPQQIKQLLQWTRSRCDRLAGQIVSIKNPNITSSANMLSPNDVAAQGLRSALSRLEQLFDLKFGMSPDKVTTLRGSNHSAFRQHTGGNTSSTHAAGASSSSTDALGDEANHNQHGSVGNELLGSGAPTNELKRLERKKVTKDQHQLACLYSKHHQVHNKPPSCAFDGADSMSEVAQHLRTRAHNSFWFLCRTCYQYIVSQAELNGLHGPNLCPPAPQPRRSRLEKVAQHWRSLYEKVFPQATRIPSPCKFNALFCI